MQETSPLARWAFGWSWSTKALLAFLTTTFSLNLMLGLVIELYNQVAWTIRDLKTRLAAYLNFLTLRMELIWWILHVWRRRTSLMQTYSGLKRSENGMVSLRRSQG